MSFKPAIIYPARNDVSHENEININRLAEMLPAHNFPRAFGGKKEEFISIVCNPEYDIIMSFHGGKVDSGNDSNSSLELIKRITDNDWRLLEHHKHKVFIGRSDITYLLTELSQRGFTCYYGPNYTSLANIEHTQHTLNTTLEYLKKALFAKQEYTIDFSDPLISNGSEPWVINKGAVTGRLIGGNFSTLCSMARENPKFLDYTDGDILFIEEVDPEYFQYHDGTIRGTYMSNLTSLISTGVFDCIAGLIIGKSKTPCFDGYTDSTDERLFLEKAIKSACNRDIPILANVSCSHTVPMITLPLHQQIKLDADSCAVTIIR